MARRTRLLHPPLGCRLARTGTASNVLEHDRPGLGADHRGRLRQDLRLRRDELGEGLRASGGGAPIAEATGSAVTIWAPIRGWCNRQHDRFWPCYWGFESSPPSFHREAKPLFCGSPSRVKYHGMLSALTTWSQGVGDMPRWGRVW